MSERQRIWLFQTGNEAIQNTGRVRPAESTYSAAASSPHRWRPGSSLWTRLQTESSRVKTQGAAATLHYTTGARHPLFRPGFLWEALTVAPPDVEVGLLQIHHTVNPGGEKEQGKVSFDNRKWMN